MSTTEIADETVPSLPEMWAASRNGELVTGASYSEVRRDSDTGQRMRCPDCGMWVGGSSEGRIRAAVKRHRSGEACRVSRATRARQSKRRRTAPNSSALQPSARERSRSSRGRPPRRSAPRWRRCDLALIALGRCARRLRARGCGARGQPGRARPSGRGASRARRRARDRRGRHRSGNDTDLVSSARTDRVPRLRAARRRGARVSRRLRRSVLAGDRRVLGKRSHDLGTDARVSPRLFVGPRAR